MTDLDYLAEVRRFHADAVEPFKGKPVGCTEAEVAALESEVGFALATAQHWIQKLRSFLASLVR